MHTRLGLTLAVMLAQAPPAPPRHSAIKTREVEYHQGSTVLRGFVAWDDAVTGRRPGVLVVHEWWGLNQHARRQARRLAEAGYVGFALDMYGEGKVTTHPQDAQALATALMSAPGLARARFDAALAELKRDPHVDSTRLAAVGYCVGGGVVLDMARAGEDLAAVVTFHGVLATKTPAEPGKVRARLLVLAGGADPFVPPEQVEAFRREMQAAGAHFEVVTYPGAKHAFTNPDAASYGMPALAYDAAADRESWAALLRFFREVFPARARG